MPKLFYLSEIVKFAIMKEQESIDLYQRLYENVAEADVKDIFQKLVGEEVKHKAYYGEMLGGIKQEQTPRVEEGEEYQAYTAALIAHGRTASAHIPNDLSNIGKVLDYAVDREEDSVLFYTNLKNFVLPSAHAHIDLIIQQEEHHAEILLKVKEKYK